MVRIFSEANGKADTFLRSYPILKFEIDIEIEC